jgi:Cu2+-exporting ATPase
MDGSPTPTLSACPACTAAPAASALATPPAGDARLMLSLPGIHCAGCIAGVERALRASPGVRDARVNLTLKRASVDAAPEVTAADLIGVLERAGYEAHELDPTARALTETDRAGRDLLMRVAVAGFASMNVMLLSIAVWSGADGATRDLFHWISAAIVLPAVAFSGMPFFTGAWSALSAGRLNMDVPIALAILLALATSLWETMLSGHHAYFDAAIALTFFLLTGRYLDYRTRAAARSAAEELAALEVPRATRIVNGAEETVPVAELRVGDLIRVRPGARLPVDGVVTDGETEIDRSALTGETLPVPAGRGSAVTSGEVTLTGPLTIRATAVGRDTALARMADLVAVAESGRARYTALADRAARLYAPGVHILSALAFLGWFIGTGDLRIALNIAAAVLIITCPCALGLAVPAVTTAASGRLFRRGLLIKNATALERLAEVDTVVFDKTGTLTAGTPTPTNLGALAPEVRAIAASLAEGSAHPLSRAIVAAETGPHAPLENRVEVPGMGAEATWQGQRVRLGRAAWTGGGVSDQTATWLQIGTAPAIPITFTDAPRPGAAEAVAAFRAQGLRVMLLSGDTETPVRSLAETLGIEDWHAGALPDEKLALIERLSGEGSHVLMIGDGLNDTAALAAAHASISPASALDAARSASDIVLLGGSLEPLCHVTKTARAARKRIRENFQLATWYNVLAVPLAAAGLCSPLIAALAMSASSITVSLNALRLPRGPAAKEQVQ